MEQVGLVVAAVEAFAVALLCRWKGQLIEQTKVLISSSKGLQAIG